MPYGIYLSAEGAKAQATRLDVIANNLANVDTVGFKRDLAICQARYAEAIRQGSVMPGRGALDDLGGGVLVRQTKTDYSEGTLKRTKNPHDMAIRGDGFFMVRKGQDTYLTRAGNFSVTSRGELVTPQGYSVLSDSGQPVVINPDDKNFEYTDTGQVRQKGTVQNIALVKPASPEELVKQGENLFRCAGAPEPIAPEKRSVAPGFLESSTVSPTLEMTSMIEASRFLEANLNLLKSQDQLLGELVTRILRV